MTLIKLLVSFGCKPILGSSRMYNEPTRLLPKEVARLILWDSPPEKVFDFLFSVKYPSPTIFKNFSLS